jgi:hypothetical protein
MIWAFLRHLGEVPLDIWLVWVVWGGIVYGLVVVAGRVQEPAYAQSVGGLAILLGSVLAISMSSALLPELWSMFGVCFGGRPCPA